MLSSGGLSTLPSRESIADETEGPSRRARSISRLAAAASGLSITLPSDTPFEDLVPTEHLLGEGTSSQVYVATFDGQPVALKRIKPFMVTPHGHREFDFESFAAEVGRTAKLNSPYVVKFVGYTAEPCCLMLEYMSGGTLAQYLSRHRPDVLEWEKRLAIARDIIQGIAYLHSVGVVHRDIKSTNVLMDAEGRAKLSDFGAEFSCGTFAYMAPELFDADEENETSTKADIYAFAIVLWELVSDAVPLAGVKMIDRDPINMVTHFKIPEGTPVAYQGLITQSWQHDPSERPTADALAEQLNALTITPDEVAVWKAKRK